MRLNLCSRCERHVAPSDTRCPFCHAKLGTVDARAVGAAWVMVAGLAMVGCAPEKSPGTDDASCDADGDDTCTADSGDATTQDSESDYGGEDYAGGGDYTDTEDYGAEDYAGAGDYTDEYGEDTSTETGDTGSEDTGSSGTGSEDTGSGTDTDTDTTEPPDGSEDSGGEDYAGPPPGVGRE